MRRALPVVVLLGLLLAGTAWTATAPKFGKGGGGFTETTYAADGKTVVSTVKSGNLPGPSGTVSSQPLSTVTAPLDSEGAGCKSLDAWVYMDSFLGDLVWKFHQDVYWCWTYPKITTLNVGTHVSDVDPLTAQYKGVVASNGYYYTWRGADKGGHYSFRQARFDNCVFKYGCISSWYPWVKVWINGNGASTFSWYTG